VLNGLKLATNQADIARAVCEGVCFAIRDVIDVMEGLGHQIRELRVTGGPAESDVLNQMKADITGKPVLLPAVSEAELVGCLIIAARGLGKYGSFMEAAQALVSVETVYQPDLTHADDYDRLFKTYRNSYARLKDEFCNLCEGEN
jgi:xylulokinase